jgi:hypothetical protein
VKYVLILVLLLFATACPAQIIVSVSDQVPPPVKYPPEVYKMTDAEFFKWATEYNKAQADDWKKRKSEIQEPEFLTGTETVTTTEYGGSYGRLSYGYGYGGGYFARSSYGCGSRYGGSFDGSSVQRTGTYPWRRPNPAYVGPGPLVIVNPYVRPK